MRATWRTSSRPSRRSARPRGRAAGLTLREVVAGLALLSTLLVAVLTTRAKLTRQWAAAERRLRATEAADALLTAWWQDVKTFPRRASGAVPGDDRMSWRTEVVSNELADRLEATVVRLEVFGDPAGPGAAD